MSSPSKNRLWETLTRPIPLKWTWKDGVALAILALIVLIKNALSKSGTSGHRLLAFPPVYVIFALP